MSKNPYRCVGVTAAGLPCGSAYVQANGWCWMHDPDRRGEVAARNVRMRERETVERRRRLDDELAGPRETKQLRARRGDLYRRALQVRLFERFDAGQVTLGEAAAELECSESSIYKMRVAWDLDRRAAEAAGEWQMSPGAQAAFDDFELFRARYFRTPETDRPYLMKPYHRRWVKAIRGAVDQGGRQMILSPPRHGKTDLLIHFCVWLIVRNPAVRILWVGGSEDVAAQSIDAVRDALENSEALIADFLPPGVTWRPPSGGMWSATRFKVANRPAGIKSPTMVAVGRGSRLPSRDADFIVCDDLEDIDSVNQPSNRENTRNWFLVSLNTRKMRHTAILYITSRVHPDDLSGHLLDNQQWGRNAIVEHMHDPACVRDPDQPHRHRACMLMPELYPYSYYLEQRSSFSLSGGPERFEMVYQNVDRPLGMRHFTVAVLHPARNMARAVGDIPPGMRLIGGLDPATVGGQAAFLWAYQTRPATSLAMVDLDLEQGGGLVGIRRIVRAWYEGYWLTEWVMEDVDTTRIARNDSELMDYCARHNIRIYSHVTGVNKWDAAYGVTSLVPLFEAGAVDLPYADDRDTRAKTDIYVAQLLRFTGDPRQAKKPNTSDLVMASWFPKDRIRLARLSDVRHAQRTQPDLVSGAGAEFAWPYD